MSKPKSKFKSKSKLYQGERERQKIQNSDTDFDADDEDDNFGELKSNSDSINEVDNRFIFHVDAIIALKFANSYIIIIYAEKGFISLDVVTM